MGRLMIVIPIAVAFAAGWTLASGRAPIAEARPKATCKDDLAKVRRELAASQAANAKLNVELDAILGKERRRAEALEQSHGKNDPIRELK